MMEIEKKLDFNTRPLDNVLQQLSETHLYNEDTLLSIENV